MRWFRSIGPTEQGVTVSRWRCVTNLKCGALRVNRKGDKNSRRRDDEKGVTVTRGDDGADTVGTAAGAAAGDGRSGMSGAKGGWRGALGSAAMPIGSCGSGAHAHTNARTRTHLFPKSPAPPGPTSGYAGAVACRFVIH